MKVIFSIWDAPSLGIWFGFKLEDFWVGAYWINKDLYRMGRFTDVYICLLPCFPIRILYRSHDD